jgi:hypothetical protein
MTSGLNPPPTAKNGHTVRVTIACRVSNPGPGKQRMRLSERLDRSNLRTGAHMCLDGHYCVAARGPSVTACCSASLFS